MCVSCVSVCNCTRVGRVVSWHHLWHSVYSNSPEVLIYNKIFFPFFFFLVAKRNTNFPHRSCLDWSVWWGFFHFWLKCSFSLPEDAAPFPTMNSWNTKASDVSPICKPKLDYSPLHSEGHWDRSTGSWKRCRKWTLRRGLKGGTQWKSQKRLSLLLICLFIKTPWMNREFGVIKQAVRVPPAYTPWRSSWQPLPCS